MVSGACALLVSVDPGDRRRSVEGHLDVLLRLAEVDDTIELLVHYIVETNHMIIHILIRLLAQVL